MKIAEIIERISAGAMVSELAAEIGITTSGLRNRISRAGVKAKDLRREALRQKAKPMLDSGMTAKAVADALGEIYQTVLNAVPEHKRPKRQVITPQLKHEVLRLNKKGVAVYIISELTLLTKQRVHRIIDNESKK